MHTMLYSMVCDDAPHLRRDSSWLKPLRSPPVGVGAAPQAADGMGSNLLQKVGWDTCAARARQHQAPLKLSQQPAG